MDAKSMKPQLRRALYFFYENKTDSMTAYEMDLLNKLVDKSSKWNLVKDETFRRDLLDFRKEHVLHWPSRYFLRWADCYEEIKKKVEGCLHLRCFKVAEPTKATNRHLD